MRDPLLRLIEDDDLRTRMGRCARERVARTAAIERIAERYAEACERLTRGLPPASAEAVS